MSNSLANKFYRHKHGGLDIVLRVSDGNIDENRTVKYIHLYPFTSALYERPLMEWTPDRYEELTLQQVRELVTSDPVVLRERITQNRNK